MVLRGAAASIVVGGGVVGTLSKTMERLRAEETFLDGAVLRFSRNLGVPACVLTASASVARLKSSDIERSGALGEMNDEPTELASSELPLGVKPAGLRFCIKKLPLPFAIASVESSSMSNDD